MKLTSFQTLDFLCKANQIGVSTTVIEAPGKTGHLICMDYDWLIPGNLTREVAYFHNDGSVMSWEFSQQQGATIDYHTAKALFEAKISNPAAHERV